MEETGKENIVEDIGKDVDIEQCSNNEQEQTWSSTWISLPKQVQDEVFEEDAPGLLDMMQMKVVSRKFLVWLASIALLCTDKITSEHWVWITATYLGVNSAVRLAAILKGRTASVKD